MKNIHSWKNTDVVFTIYKGAFVKYQTIGKWNEIYWIPMYNHKKYRTIGIIGIIRKLTKKWKKLLTAIFIVYFLKVLDITIFSHDIDWLMYWHGLMICSQRCILWQSLLPAVYIVCRGILSMNFEIWGLRLTFPGTTGASPVAKIWLWKNWKAQRMQCHITPDVIQLTFIYSQKSSSFRKPIKKDISSIADPIHKTKN